MSAQTSTSPPRSTTITVSVIACHAGLVVECPEEQAEEVAWFIEEVMVAGMNQVLNSWSGRRPPRADSTPTLAVRLLRRLFDTLVGSRALKRASITSTTDPSSVPNHKSLGMYSSYREGIPGCPAAPPALPRTGQHNFLVV